MTTDEEVNFGTVVTSPPPPFNLTFPVSKDLPAMNCFDLFPNPPRQIYDDYDSLSALLSSDAIRPLTENAETSNDQDVSCDNIPKNSNQQNDTLSQLIGNQSATLEARRSENDSGTADDERKTPNQTSLPVVSPALSLSSYYSSTESVSSSTSKKKKKRKRHCYTCDMHFRHSSELLDHLKSHVVLPAIQVEPLPENDLHIQEYRERQKLSVSPECDRASTPSEKSGGQIEPGGLKLKLKLSGSQNNFQVVPVDRSTDEYSKKNITRILTAREIKSSPPHSGVPDPLDAMAAFSEMHLKQQAEESLLENKYFECPTLEGLDQFAEEVNSEVAEDLLKKLLHDGQQLSHNDNDWSSSNINENTNEFISIDRLAYMCTICNSNFPDAIRLSEHRRITGHNNQHPMQPPPPPGMPMGHQLRFRQHFPPMPQHSQIMGGPHRMQHPCGPTPMNMRPNFAPYPPRFPIMGPGFNQPPQARRPPPLYRVPIPQNAAPLNMVPFAEMNPEMYIPSSNGNMIINGHHFPPTQPPNPMFLKARLQRPGSRPRTPGMNDTSPSVTPPMPPAVLTNQMATRPRFLQPMPGPPIKKIKLEKGSDECTFVSTQSRQDGFPVIQSVQGGATATFEPERQQKEPIQLNDQITLSLKNKEQTKNPKDVASILATRGIIVTHKPKAGTESRETSPKNVAQEAVQKLQLNNSVSIISKKRSLDATNATDEAANKPRGGESAFISCPVSECEEKFLTQEGLNRHTQRGHKLRRIGLKAFKCKLCPAIFSTQEGLIDHQRKNHRILKTSADELGIPIIDLRNEQTKQKLAQLGIVNYIPLNAKSANGCFGFPIVSVQGAANPNICNVLGMGVSSLLSLGPIKQIPGRKMD